MPELPEVETVRRALSKRVLEKTIQTVVLNLDKALRNQKKSFLINLEGETIKSFERKGKNLIMVLNNYFVVMHLRMEGKFYHLPLADNSANYHNVITFNFAKTKLLFNDHRKFATIDIYNSRIELNKFLDTIGPEPWDVNVKNLFEQIKNKKIAIKSTLLDQKLVSGLGNIYVDEVLFASRILPTRPTNEITFEELTTLINNAKDILKRATAAGGSTIATFHAMDGVDGRFQTELQVHRKKGQPCPDGSKVLKTVVGGRGTYYCLGVQK